MLLNIPEVRGGWTGCNMCLMLNRQVYYGLPAAGAVCSARAGCPGVTACLCWGSCSSLPRQGQTQLLVLLTCPKQSIYLCSHTDAPAKLAALIISALSLQAFTAIWNINFASLQVSKGFFFFQGTQFAVKWNCQVLVITKTLLQSAYLG